MTHNPKRPLNRPQDLPQERYTRVEVLRLKGGQRVEGWILSQWFWGVTIHWNQGTRRSEPCFGKEKGCQGCEQELPEKRRWYIHLAIGGKKTVFLELTEEGAMLLRDQLADGEKLRGLRIVVSRTTADNGRLRVEINWDVKREVDLPVGIDPEETLRKLWDWKKK